MDAQDMMTQVAEKERELAQLTARIDAMDEQIVLGGKLRAELRDALGCDDAGVPLPMAPLVAALLGAIAANAAMFFSLVVWLTRFHETIWNSLLVVSLLIGVASIPPSKRAGAGGLARLGLRRFAIVAVVIALLGVVAAVVSPRGH